MPIRFSYVGIALLGVILAAPSLFGDVVFPTDDSDIALESDVVGPTAALPVSVTFKTIVEADRPRVLFTDLATCVGSDALCLEVSAIDFGKAPRPGSTFVVVRSKLEKILELEVPHVQFKFDGPKRIKVTSNSMRITREMVADSLRAALETSLQEVPELRLASVSVQLASPLKVFPGDYSLSFPIVEQAHANRLDWIADHFLGVSTFDAVYASEGGQVEALPFKIQARIKLEKQLPVTKRHLQRGEIVRHEHLEYKWRTVTRSSIHLADEIKHLVGLRLKQSVRSGQALSTRQLEVPRAVARGQLVKLLINRNGLAISGQAKALSSGGIGQTIRVIYPQTKKSIQAKIIDASTVEVIF